MSITTQPRLQFLLISALALFMLTLAACQSDLDLTGGEVDERSDGIYYLKDEQGRSLILRGVNVSNDAKWDPLRVGSIDQGMVQRFSRDWGFNAVRMLIFWDAIEPVKGFYDTEYLDRVEERLDWYAEEGIMVILDMHQDVYSSVFCCDGAPAWAVRDDGEPFEEQEVWWQNYNQPAVERSFDNFWDYQGPHADLQEHYTKAWLQVISRFKDHPAILGYDLINEPHEGSASSLTFERKVLTDFYRRLIAEIREVDHDNWIFYEPLGGLVVTGLPSGLQPISDPRDGEPRLAYFPHLYEPSLSMGVPYLGIKTFIKAWRASRLYEMEKFQAPVLIGEFGEDETKYGFMRYLRDMFTLTQSTTSGWFLWTYDNGTWGLLDENGHENKKLDLLVQPYPSAIAGEPLHFNYDFGNKAMTLRYRNTADISGTTDIFIPQQRVYPGGFAVHVIPQSLQWQWDADKQQLSIDSDQAMLSDDTAIQIKITPN